LEVHVPDERFSEEPVDDLNGQQISTGAVANVSRWISREQESVAETTFKHAQRSDSFLMQPVCEIRSIEDVQHGIRFHPCTPNQNKSQTRIEMHSPESKDRP
jgi:hypothetical protein